MTCVAQDKHRLLTKKRHIFALLSCEQSVKYSFYHRVLKKISSLKKSLGPIILVYALAKLSNTAYFTF